jgi:PAS domain S-box-containing protein
MADTTYITRDPSPQSEADEKFRLAVEACPNGMLMMDSAGRILLANTEIERLFGYQHSELFDQTIEILLPERLHGMHLRHRAAFARHPEHRPLGHNRRLLCRHRDGSELPVEIGLYPINSGKAVLVLSMIIDITERRRMDRLKDEFVSTVSHELRTPLTSIAASLGLLTGGAAGTLPEPAARLIHIAESNSKRLVRLINDILDIQKIESGQVSFKFKRFDARPLVEHLIEASRGYADGFHVHLRLDAEAAAGEMYADPDRLSQVITNLLSNAIKFSPPDGEVVVAIEQHEHSVRIAVRDHGQGIPRLFRSHVFEKFAQADASDAGQKTGTGLGLSIVQQIVSRLGGTVGFDGAIGGGTIFCIELPSWAKVAARESDTGGDPHAARILLCEDKLDVAYALRDRLRPAGFSTDFAHPPADAITRARAIHYGAILVDLDLPDGDGIGLIQALRAQPEFFKTPIVVISADSARDKTAGPDLVQLNVLEHLQTPVDIHRLTQILDSVIVRDGNGRAQILHVDDDQNVLEIVARTLDSIARVVSVNSIEEARFALLQHRFDLAILDIRLGAVSGLDLLSELHSNKGDPIPVIIFTAHATGFTDNPQVQASLDKSSSASLEDLMTAVRDRLRLRSPQAPTEVA